MTLHQQKAKHPVPITAEYTLYPGVNPHLNSLLQQPDGQWQSFHSSHINDIADILNTLLPRHYYATTERSLQLATYDDISSYMSRSRADVMIQRTSPDVDSVQSGTGATPTLTLSTVEHVLLDADEEQLMSVVIRRVDGDQIVTRLELLSPANKPPGAHFGTYVQKRSDTLLAGIAVVEIDYLHERRPTLARIPAYASGDAGAYPYHIITMSLHPSPRDAQTRIYGFGVLGALPSITVPLATDEVLMVNFGRFYRHTASKRQFTIKLDYEKPPANFAAYTKVDQQAIQQFMANIKNNQA